MTAPNVISCDQIQSELSRIWETLEGTNKMRASLFNLIFYIQKNYRAEYMRKIAKKVVEKFPSRIIMITADKNTGEDYLKASVSVLTASSGACDVACDFIDIQVAGAQQERIPFVILPHILPDLPVYLLWSEDPTVDDPLSLQLEKFATRLIFDSESTSNLPRFAKAILERKERVSCDIADLNWARLESWRDLLTQTFYSPERFEELKHARTIQINYNAQETPSFSHTKIQSVYLQAWLACQLKWELSEILKDKDSLSFIYSKENNPIKISLNPVRYGNVAPGTVVSLELVTDQQHHFFFGRNLQFPNQVTMQISSPEICELPSKVIFGKAESGQSLVKEIAHRGTSSHYLKVLNSITKMDPTGLC